MTRSPELTTVKNELNERIDYHRKLMKKAAEHGDPEELFSHLAVIRELEWIKKDLGLDLKLI